MSLLTVDQQLARQNLQQAWSKIGDNSISVPTDILDRLETILHSDDVTYKYILITGLLGKLTYPQVHPRAIQAQSSLLGAYDARSLCHKVVVGFEKGTTKNLFGLSNEPFVNKPARHPEHDKNNPQLRNKKIATPTHDVLEFAHTASPDVVEAILVSAPRIADHRAAVQVEAVLDTDANYRHVLRFVSALLEVHKEGAMLAAITGAFVTALSEKYTVKVHPTTVSDKFAGTAGDVEVFNKTTCVAAYECKERSLTLEDIQHGLKKTREKGVPEYCFVYADGIAEGQEDSIQHAIAAVEDKQDVPLINIHAATRYWAAMMNPVRRATFGPLVATILRDSINRPNLADKAAELWNQSKSDSPLASPGEG